MSKALLLFAALAGFGTTLLLGLHWLRAQIAAIPEAGGWAEFVDKLGSIGILLIILGIYYKINESDKKYYRDEIEKQNQLNGKQADKIHDLMERLADKN